MKNRITRNLSLKILSLLIGIVVWLLVVNLDNPVITKNFILQDVELVNEAYIDATGKVALKTGEQTSIRVTVKGARKTVGRLSVADIKATADLQQAVNLDTKPVMIPISVTVTGIVSSNISVWPQNISVTLEDKVSNEFIVAVNNGESKPGSGYEVGTQTVSPEKLRVTGPRSLMNKIDKVNVNNNLGGTTSDQTTTGTVVVIDKNGEALTDVQMSNLKIENGGQVTVTTRLWKVRTDVALNAGYTGTPEDGYRVDSVSSVPSTVSVAGSAEALDTLRQNGYRIEISEKVDVTGADSDVEQKVDFSQDLPDEIKLTSGTSSEALLNAVIVPDESRIFTIPTSHIEIENLPKGMQAAFALEKIEIRVKASDDEDMENFDLDKVKVSVDLEGENEGTSDFKVDVELPDGFELIDDVTAQITISEVANAD